MSESPTPVQDLRCQSGPSAKNSVIFSGGDSSKNYGADQQRLQISVRSSLWQVPNTSDVCLLKDKIQDRGMYLFTISSGSDAVDQRSGDGWFSGWMRFSSSTRGISMPNFEVLDARIASLNMIIHNSHFKRRISLEEPKAQKQDRFLRGRQIALLSLTGHWEPFLALQGLL